MSEQDGAQGQPWRTEPEIDEERQKYLAERRSIKPDIEQGIFPFKDIKLSRSDVEWLLVTHENGRGPVDWNEESQRERKGLDLRGADLRGAKLQNLPLARLYGGLNEDEGLVYEKLSEAGVQLEEAILSRAHLEGALLTSANLMRANFEEGYLEKANFTYALGEKAVFLRSHLEMAKFNDANLEEANFGWTFMQKAFFLEADLKRASFSEAHLEEANFTGSQMEVVNFTGAYLNNAILGALEVEHFGPHLEGARFYSAHLEGAALNYAYLGGKKVDVDDEERVKLWYMRYPKSIWPENMQIVKPADFTRAFFDTATNLENAELGDEAYGFVSLA